MVGAPKAKGDKTGTVLFDFFEVLFTAFESSRTEPYCLVETGLKLFYFGSNRPYNVIGDIYGETSACFFPL